MTKGTILCDHFAFASAPAAEGGACRYGITARSPGVDDRTVGLLDGNLYPAGVDQGRFARSVSMIVLDEKVALTQARNAGDDSEGRPNSIYSHTVLVDRGDFESIGCDTRVVAMQCPRAEQAGSVGPLEIKRLDLGMDLASARRLGLARLHPFLESMFSGRSVAIGGLDDADLLPGLLSLLPPPLRLVPFTSMLPDPTRRHPFRLAQTGAPRPMPGDCAVIDAAGGLSGTPAAPKTLLGRCVGRLVRMVADGDEDGIGSLYGELGALSGLGYDKRLCAAAGARMYGEGLLRSPAWAGRLARMLDSAPVAGAAPCYGRLERFLSDGDRGRYSKRYGARLLAARYAARALDAAALAEMLEQCGDGGPGGGPSARELAEALLDERPDEMRESGAEMLSSAAHRADAGDVAGVFASSDLLRPSIAGALRGLQRSDPDGYHSLFVAAAGSMLAANSPHLGEFFGADTCDLGSDGGARLFCRAASSAFSGVGEGAEVGPLADAAEALHGRILAEASRAGAGGLDGRLSHLGGALDGARAALVRALDGARRRGEAPDGPALRRAKETAGAIAATVDRMRLPRRPVPPVTFSAPAWWQMWLWPLRYPGFAIPGGGAARIAGGGPGEEPEK